MAVVSTQLWRSIGWLHITGDTVLQFTVTGTTTIPALSFVVDKNPFSSGSIEFGAFRFYIDTATGSPQVTCEIWSDNFGVPGSLVTNGTSDQTAVLSAGWVDVTWSTRPTLTAGSQYHVVVKVTVGTSVRMRISRSNSLIGALGGNGTGSGAAWRSSWVSSTDGGSTWAGTPYYAVAGYRIKLTNGTDDAYTGVPVDNSYQARNASGERANGTQLAGVFLTTPADEVRRIKSVAMYVRKLGTPGNITLYIYDGAASSPSLLATSNAIPGGNLATSPLIYQFDFPTVYALAASTKYRFLLGAASGDSSNYYYTYAHTWDSDAQSTPLNTLSIGHAVLSGGTVTEQSSVVPHIGFVLDSDNPYTAAAGGGPVPGMRVYGPSPSRRRRAA